MSAALARWLLPVSTALLGAAVAIVVLLLLRGPKEPPLADAGRGAVPAAGAEAQKPGDGAADALVRRMNETTAVNVLTSLALRQVEVRADVRIDVDHDGRGEAAGFVELSGGTSERRATPIVPPALPRENGTLDERGELSRGGYRFRIFLPGPDGSAVGEGPRGFSAADVDPAAAARSWWAYAWPERKGVTGDRTFFVDPSGVFSSDGPWSGPGGGPPASAASRGGGAGEWRPVR